MSTEMQDQPMLWTGVWCCCKCGIVEQPPNSPRAQQRRKLKWTKINKRQFACPACTRMANRDCQKELRSLQHMDDKQLETEKYHIWWHELMWAPNVES